MVCFAALKNISVERLHYIRVGVRCTCDVRIISISNIESIVEIRQRFDDLSVEKSSRSILRTLEDIVVRYNFLRSWQ